MMKREKDPTEIIIQRIEDIRESDKESGTYLSATLFWMDECGYNLDAKSVNSVVPSFIIEKIKNEAYDENLVKPSMKPGSQTTNGLFDQFF